MTNEEWWRMYGKQDNETKKKLQAEQMRKEMELDIAAFDAAENMQKKFGCTLDDCKCTHACLMRTACNSLMHKDSILKDYEKELNDVDHILEDHEDELDETEKLKNEIVNGLNAYLYDTTIGSMLRNIGKELN